MSAVPRRTARSVNAAVVSQLPLASANLSSFVSPLTYNLALIPHSHY